MTLRYACLLLLLMGLAACEDKSSRFDPEVCPHWSIDVAAPRHMEAWVEALWVTDVDGGFLRVPQGVVGELPQTAGWSGLTGGGSSMRFKQAGAPLEIYVRWQSLAEPQTYNWQFTVPERMRQALVKREMGKVWYKQRPEMSCRSDITIGVAPGGHTIAWISGEGLPAVEMLRGQAEVEPLGPWQGKGKEYAYPLSDEAKAYVQQHGIPYDSW